MSGARKPPHPLYPWVSGPECEPPEAPSLEVALCEVHSLGLQAAITYLAGRSGARTCAECCDVIEHEQRAQRILPT